MPIVTSSYTTSPMADGSQHVVERHYDQDGGEFMVTWLAPAGTDIAAVMNSRVSSLNDQLADAEFERIVRSEQ